MMVFLTAVGNAEVAINLHEIAFVEPLRPGYWHTASDGRRWLSKTEMTRIVVSTGHEVIVPRAFKEIEGIIASVAD